jgi:beta-glucosidase
MSSFNYIGLTWAGGNKALLTDIVRNEWGFKGVVITDAAIHPHMNPVQFLQAGADLSLDILSAWGVPGQSGVIQAAAENTATKAGTITNLQRASKNMLYAVSRSWIAAD